MEFGEVPGATAGAFEERGKRDDLRKLRGVQVIVLGLHGGVTLGQHDPAACVVVNGTPVSLCEEERYTRIKSCYGMLPEKSIAAALKAAGVAWREVDLVVVPGITYSDVAERWRHHLTHLYGTCPKIERVHHQLSHAATAFYGSGWKETLILSLDASGDGCAGLFGWEAGEKLQPHHFSFPKTENSIGYFYTLMTQYCGFADGDEYKLMGLAPYGKPTIDLSKIIRPTNDGWQFDWSYVRDNPPCRSPFEPLYSDKLFSLLGQRNRKPGDSVGEFYKDVAASVQKMFEDCLLSLVRRMKSEAKYDRLVYAGGCALNCKANRLLKDEFSEIYIPPVAGDRGLALGCAYLGAEMLGDKPEPLHTAYLGTEYRDGEITHELTMNGVSYRQVECPESAAAELIAQGKVVGWFQGRSEAGARALGNRSILARPDLPDMRNIVNQRIKYREEFRPFAPAVCQDDSSDYFEPGSYPYMTMAVKARQELPAVVHVDGTARVQTVSQDDNPRFYGLMKAVEGECGVPAVLNTSFNLKGQPIVESPRDAIATFYSCGLDALVIGNCVVKK